MTDLRCLNYDGIRCFKEYLAAVRIEPTLTLPTTLLDDGRFSDPLLPRTDIEARPFKDIYDLGCQLNEVLGGCDPREVSRNSGLWSWLGLSYFDGISPLSATGQRNTLSDAVYVLDGKFNFQRYYRHIVRTAWLAVLRHGEKAKVLLLSRRGGTRTDIGEQIGAYPDLFGCSTVIAAAHTLYFDADADKPKRGSGGKLAGSPRRLAAVARQLQLTYDLDDCPLEDFMALLPREFSRWRE